MTLEYKHKFDSLEKSTLISDAKRKLKYHKRGIEKMESRLEELKAED